MVQVKVFKILTPREALVADDHNDAKNLNLVSRSKGFFRFPSKLCSTDLLIHYP